MRRRLRGGDAVVADVAPSVLVAVLLAGVGHGRAVVGALTHTVLVGIDVTAAQRERVIETRPGVVRRVGVAVVEDQEVPVQKYFSPLS